MASQQTAGLVGRSAVRASLSPGLKLPGPTAPGSMPVGWRYFGVEAVADVD